MLYVQAQAYIFHGLSRDLYTKHVTGATHAVPAQTHNKNVFSLWQYAAYVITGKFFVYTATLTRGVTFIRP